MNASDCITLNVGGKIFQTTKTTLKMSGAGYFEALFRTGPSLSKAVNDNDSKNVLFMDRDGSIFDDVLYFMRCSKLRPQTRVSLSLLEELKTEAEFLSYVDLVEACDFAIHKLNSTLLQALQPKARPFLALGPLVVQPNDLPQRVNIKEGEVLYIASATLSGRCRFKRYRKGENDTSTDTPSCYLDTCVLPADQGDFQLLVNFGGQLEQDRLCIAHLGMDNIHVASHPVNYDLRQDLRICVAPCAGRKFVELEARGAGDWHVLCFVGRPENIPGLEKESRSGSRCMMENLSEGASLNSMTDTDASYKLLALASLSNC